MSGTLTHFGHFTPQRFGQGLAPGQGCHDRGEQGKNDLHFHMLSSANTDAQSQLGNGKRLANVGRNLSSLSLLRTP